MPQYVQAITVNNQQLFPKCGTREVAGTVSNIGNTAGGDFSYVYESIFSVVQPHNHSGNSSNSAAFQHQITIVVPDYEPIQSAALNLLNEHNTVQKLVLNATRRDGTGAQDKLTGQYTAENGLLVNYHRANSEGRGSIVLTFVFEKITHEDKVGLSSGLLKTTAA